MIVTEYETIYVVKPELPEDALVALNDKVNTIVEKNQGIMLTVDDWGKRKLAYPIQKNSKGHYIYINYLAPSDLVAELERNLRIEDNLLRFLTVKLDVDVDIEPRKIKAAEDNAKRSEQRAARAAAEAEAQAAAEVAEAEQAARAAAREAYARENAEREARAAAAEAAKAAEAEQADEADEAADAGDAGDAGDAAEAGEAEEAADGGEA